MASIKVQPKNYSMVTTNKFLGMNVENELQLNPGEFTDMENFRITEDYKLEKRKGFKAFEIDNTGYEDFKYFYVVNDNQIAKLLNTDKEYLYLFGYTGLDVNLENPFFPQAYIGLFRVDIKELKIKEELWRSSASEIKSPDWLMFKNNGYLYFTTNINYIPIGQTTPYPWVAMYKTDGTESGTVYIGDDTITTPTLYYQAAPQRQDWPSKKLEPVNILTDTCKINYLADGTASYLLDVRTIDYMGFIDIISVTINGVTTTAYTRPSKDRVLFDVAPTAEATVEIEYSVIGANPATLIYDCTNSMWYGGQNDMDLFVWGNPDYPSTVYHSYAGDPLFFADVGFRTFGDETITDVVVQNTTQLVFGEKSIFRTIVSANEAVANLTEYTAELIVRSKGHKKWTPNTNVQIIDNRPVFISEDGTINELVIISDRDERNVRQLSGRDMSSVLRSTDAVTRVITSTFDFEPKKEYWILFDETTQGETTHKALIYNYGNDTWYKHSGLYDCATPLLINYQMYMFGDVFSKMDESLFADIDINGISHAISAYATTPFLSFNKDFLYKSVQKLFISLSNNFEKDSYVKVEYWTSEEPRRQSINCYLRAGEPPRTESKVIGASRFMFMKFSFISDRVDNACTLINYSVKLHYAGEVRT